MRFREAALYSRVNLYVSTAGTHTTNGSTHEVGCNGQHERKDEDQCGKGQLAAIDRVNAQHRGH